MNKLLEKIDQLHEKDTVIENDGNKDVPRELLYSRRMVEKLKETEPGHEPYLEIAARCHHLCRWEIPRDNYPEGKAGYYQWRKEVYEHQWNIAKSLMAEEGIDYAEQLKVGRIIKKEGIKNFPDVQLMEDVACLVFIEYYLSPFSARYPDEKLVEIIQKTTKKMSGQGLSQISRLKVDEKVQKLLGKRILFI